MTDWQIALALALVATILCAIELVRSRGTNLVAWAVLALAMIPVLLGLD